MGSQDSTAWGTGRVAGPVGADSQRQYDDHVPPAVARLWRERGQVVTPDGFLRLIDPGALTPHRSLLWPDLPDAIPLVTTAWGDVVVATGGALRLSLFRHGLHTGLLATADDAILEILVDPQVQTAVLQRGGYDNAVRHHGVPEIDEVLGHTLPLQLGGSRSVDNISRQPLVEHLAFLVSAVPGGQSVAQAEHQSAVEAAADRPLPPSPWPGQAGSED